MFVLSAICTVLVFFSHLLLIYIQKQKVSLLKSFVERPVGLNFYIFLAVFKSFQNMFSLHNYHIHHIVIGMFFSYSSFFIFLFYFLSCDSHLRTCYSSAFLWEKSGLSFTPSPVTIYQIWTVQYCNPISCSFSRLFRYRVYTIHPQKPSSCNIKYIYVNMALRIWIMLRDYADIYVFRETNGGIFGNLAIKNTMYSG